MKKLSIIVPFYNEEQNIVRYFEQTEKVLLKSGYDYEFICIDDGSYDNTFILLKSISELNDRVKIIKLSRNFGKESALTAGFNFSDGDAVISMDSDLQHPPDVILQFLEKWEEGYEIVFAFCKNRFHQGFFLRMVSHFYHFLINKIASFDIDKNAGDFRLMDRKVINSFNKIKEKNRYLKGLYSWLGFRKIGIAFSFPERELGSSKFSFSKLLALSIDGITSFSAVPIRFFTFLGMIISFFSICYGFYLILKTILLGIDVPGYTSLIVSVIVLGGLNLLGLGVVGEYICKIFNETKNRPIYVVSEKLGFKKESKVETHANEFMEEYFLSKI